MNKMSDHFPNFHGNAQVVFCKPRPCPVGSLLMPSSNAFMYELRTFPLRLRDMCLSPITPSTFLLAFGLAVIQGSTLALARWPDVCFKAVGLVQATGFKILLPRWASGFNPLLTTS